MKVKVLNLYAGIGGNRKLWEDVEVTAVELDPEIAKLYKEFFPDDIVIVADAHQYLLDHITDGWDFIWASPPCQSHTHMNHTLFAEGVRRYPYMALYQEIIYLKSFFKGKYAVENVVPYYEAIMPPTFQGKKGGHGVRHNVWANFFISDFKTNLKRISVTNGKATCRRSKEEFLNELQKAYGFNTDNIQGLANYVEPDFGKHIFDCAFKFKQSTLYITGGK